MSILYEKIFAAPPPLFLEIPPRRGTRDLLSERKSPPVGSPLLRTCPPPEKVFTSNCFFYGFVV